MNTKTFSYILIASFALSACAPQNGPTREELKANTSVFIDEDDAVRPSVQISTEDGLVDGKSEYSDIDLPEDEEMFAREEQTLLEQGEMTAVTTKKGKPAKKKRAPGIDRSKITVGSSSGGGELANNTATSFPPASIAKLITSGVALEKLGTEFRFTNSMVYRPVADRPGVVTDFRWVSDGDPTLGHSHFEPGQVAKFAVGLKAKGIKKIIGPIVLQPNDPRFAGGIAPPGTPDWELGLCYGAPARDFNMNNNCVGGGSLSRAALGKDQVKAALKKILEDQLKANGIVLEPNGKATGGAFVATPFQSAKIDRIIYHMNKPSDNLLANSLFRAVAMTDADKTSGPFEVAAKVYKQTVTGWMNTVKAPQLAPELAFLDGAGLSPLSKSTPRSFLQVLKYLAQAPYFKTIWESLPVGGVDGTLKARYKNPLVKGKVRAKTGTMGGHYQLAGYLPRYGADGKSVKELVPFVILTSTPVSDAYQSGTRSYQEEIVTNLMRKINQR